MIKQDWMVIVAGEALVDAMSAEQKRRCEWTGSGGYNSSQLCQLQQDQASREEVNMHYVIYSPAYNLYVNDEGGLGSYEVAAKFNNVADAEWNLDTTTTGLRIVGPCSEEP